MAGKNGLATVPTALFRPTAAAAVEPPAEQLEPAEATTEQGTASQTDTRPAKPRRKRQPAGGETRGRKLILPDSVFDRLQLLAIRRRTTVSAIASEILDRNLPKLRIEQD